MSSRHMTFRKKLSVSLAVTSGIALTVGGLQFANAGGAEHQKAKAKAKETPSMVSAAFGDTEHLSEDEARKRLARQGKIVATAKKVRKDLKPGWSAGDYVDPKDGTLTVNVTSKRRAEDVDAPNVTPRVVSRSTTDLNAVKVSVDKLVERFTPSGVTYYIDVRKNVVTVEVARTMLDKGRTGEFVDAARKLGPAVEVKTVDKQVAPTTNMQDGDEISSSDSTCSMGWWVKKDGEDQVMTAGHCLVDGDGIWGHEGKKPIGRKDAAKFGPMDWGTIRLEGLPPLNPRGIPVPPPNVTTKVDLKHDDATAKISGFSKAPVGTEICKSGRTTGQTCGPITAHDVTVTYADGTTLEGMSQARLATDHGDSGGPVYQMDPESGDHVIAQGMVSGSPEGRDEDEVSTYQPIESALLDSDTVFVVSKD
ncbi:S1 family peptidase [Streptomyces sp. NBC_01186]|uniref:S1 family peptidase n=1 Tax=Streptomyces sp. NBC_01186 TaxID=2903765 RepID=UPI002E151D55|nr:S1 family peptidase [Streptomyces sp. NBC_01186]